MNTARIRIVGLGGVIALGLVLLATAVTQRRLTAPDAAASLAAPDFVVTSSGDAGPGTLREAILAADRLTTPARILITAKRIAIGSPLPALVNRRGIAIEAAPDAGIIDASGQETGAVLQIDSPGSVVKGVRIRNARGFGVVVNVPDVELNTIAVEDSKVAVLLSAAARDCKVLTSVFERNETAVQALAGLQRASIVSSVFRGNTRAGFWLVAASPEKAEPAPERPGRDWVRITDSVFDANATGIVVANQPTWIQKSRFIGNRDSALLVLGGTVRLEDSEVRGSTGAAVSVNSGTRVVLARNKLIDNQSMAISLRDSDVTVESNNLDRNGLGIVSIISDASIAPLVASNTIRASVGDAIMLIGGAPLLRGNQVVGNKGAGLRSLDLVQKSGAHKATPRLEANLFQGNGTDTPITGAYKLTGDM